MTHLAAFAFSELAEVSETLASLGEARSDRARRAYSDVVHDAVASAGGRKLAAAGDGVLIMFESATAALSYAGRVQRGCERESRRSNERLDVQIGIDVGEAASEPDVDLAAAAPATRARLLARAAPAGGVLASHVVPAVASVPDAAFRPAGLVELSGPADRLAAVEVVWERRAVVQPPLPADVEGRMSRPPFVGREAERERLDAVWQRALEGERPLAFVLGEPGIGKTRLVAEFAREVHDRGAAVLWGRSFEEALTPYQPFVQALQHHVRSTPPEELYEQASEGAAVLARLLPELSSRIPIPSTVTEDPESERFRLFVAVARLLAAASADRPLLLVLDDLQWADQGTLLLLKHLAGDLAPAPLMILGTYRHSEVGRDHPLALVQADVERDHLIERIELGGLEEDEVGALVAALLGRKAPDAVVRSLRGETEGNPFFLEEVVRHLEQLGFSGNLERFARAEAAVEELGVPARVRELVARRVQRLSADAQSALSAAAVIGSEFGTDLLAEMLAVPEAQLVGALDEAVEGRLLVEAPGRLGHYGFSHALVQQALYEERTINRRAALHERAAAALERLHPGPEAPHAELAYHYARAGPRHAEKVVRHGRAAGERALGMFAYEDAVRDLSAALAALDGFAGADQRERAELLALLGTAHTRAGDYLAARDAFHEAAELSAAAGAWPLLARAVLGYGGGAGFGGVWVTFADVDRELVRLLELALEACPPGDSHERVRLLGRLAQALYWSPETARAHALSEEALAIARRLGDPAALAYALDSRHVVLWSPDHLGEGRAIAEEMLALGRRLGDRDIELEALAWLITDALELDPIEVVDGYIAEHARIAAELRQPYHLWYTEAARAMRAHLDGRFAEAAALSDKAYSYGQQSHGENALQTYLVQTLFIKLDLGQLPDLVDGLEVYVRDSPLEAWHAAFAVALAGVDRRTDALEQVAWFARRGFGTIRRDCVWMTTVVALAQALATFDDPTHADELYERLLPFAGRESVVGGAVLCLGPVSRILGLLARAGGRLDLALEHFADALERSRNLGSPPLVARTQVDAARAHLRRGGTEDLATARQLLAEARVAASQLGMGTLLADIDALRGAPVGEGIS